MSLPARASAAGYSVSVALLFGLSACEPRLTSLGAWVRDPVDGSAADAARDAGVADGGARDASVARAGQYLEAEGGVLSGGFAANDDTSASAGRSLVPPASMTSEDAPGTARALYRFDVTRAASYVIWGRIHSPDAVHNRFWFRVDGGVWHKWRISTGDVWFWDALHEDTHYDTALTFALDAGEHRLELANCADGVELDRLYVTADGDMPPGNDTACHPPHSIQLGDTCQPSCGSHGTTGCGATACDGQEVFQAYDCDVCCRIAP